MLTALSAGSVPTRVDQILITRRQQVMTVSVRMDSVVFTVRLTSMSVSRTRVFMAPVMMESQDSPVIVTLDMRVRTVKRK